MRTLILQHTVEETPGSLEGWLQKKNYPYQVHKTFVGNSLPDPAAFDFLVVLGGTMNVDEESKHPWLADVKLFIRDWLKTKKHYLGICLGSQLMARALGAEVRKNLHLEVGFHPVRKLASHPALRSWPEEIFVFQWHEDTFDLPPGTRSLMASAACPNQAFALNEKQIGLQFHPESTMGWIVNNYDGLSESYFSGKTYAQSKDVCEPLMHKHLEPMRQAFYQFLDNLCG